MISVLRAATIRGQKVTVRRERLLPGRRRSPRRDPGRAGTLDLGDQVVALGQPRLVDHGLQPLDVGRVVSSAAAAASSRSRSARPSSASSRRGSSTSRWRSTDLSSSTDAGAYGPET